VVGPTELYAFKANPDRNLVAEFELTIPDTWIVDGGDGSFLFEWPSGLPGWVVILRNPAAFSVSGTPERCPEPRLCQPLSGPWQKRAFREGCRETVVGKSSLFYLA